MGDSLLPADLFAPFGSASELEMLKSERATVVTPASASCAEESAEF